MRVWYGVRRALAPVIQTDTYHTVLRKQFKLVKDVKKIFHGTTSDHLAIQMSLNLRKGKYKNFGAAKIKSQFRIDNTILRGKG